MTDRWLSHSFQGSAIVFPELLRSISQKDGLGVWQAQVNTHKGKNLTSAL
ncbi:hypothetical protein H6F86_14375 [Phormidium sp. FACHB-592]|uniref:Uncharacterized protein n=1 Tax=Stenomitos frigidus AS-A4 TaxID=2933935 RepID=A0ABV0KLQ6_9CYAN|nr:hypothetical protein [Phormidium sp. FACHB-592]MBD2075060.1 hypothetical protein [Phormidium sp. FACHB-592]